MISKDNLDTISSTKKAVIQKYIEKPHLINGRKYDLRLYVLVTSCDPLRIYIFEKGLVRFCANKYSKNNIKSKYAHLTNYSINKKSDKFVEPGEEEEVDEEVCASSFMILVFGFVFLLSIFTFAHSLSLVTHS